MLAQISKLAMARYLSGFIGVVGILALPTTINNLVPRLDNKGNIMDSHDFSLHLYPDGYYYMTSVAYGGCREPQNLGCDQTSDHCGFQVGSIRSPQNGLLKVQFPTTLRFAV